MGIFGRFKQDERGSLPRRFANIAVIIAIAAVAVATTLDRWTRDGGSSILAFLIPENPADLTHHDDIRTAQDGSVDMSPTGAISRPIVLDPCTGRVKP